MTQPSDPVTIALNMISAEITNRQVKLRDLNEQLLRLEGEVAGLREAQDRFERANKATAQ